MIFDRMKFEYQETNNGLKQYSIIYGFASVGEITFKVVKKQLHIHNVFIHEEYQGKVGFGDWLRTFETIFVYDVLPNSVFYWSRRCATIVSTTKFLSFEDIIFENVKLEEEDG